MSAPIELTVGPTTIYSLLGPFAVLLSVERSKKPTRTGWQNIRLDHTQIDEYQDELRCAPSIGVLLGEPSSGVVALDLDDDSWIERFLSLNPLWRQTLRTKGVRGCQIWLKMRAGCWYPKAVKRLKNSRDGTHVGEWRGGGGQSIICGQHPSGGRYQFLVQRPAVEISFCQIRWPYGLVLPWRQTRKDRKPAVESLIQTDDEVLAKRISRYMAAIPGAVSGNGGHDQTYSVAMALINGWGLPRGQAMRYLQFYNQRCGPPWSQKELDHKIDDAIRLEDKAAKGHLRGEEGRAINTKESP